MICFYSIFRVFLVFWQKSTTTACLLLRIEFSWMMHIDEFWQVWKTDFNRKKLGNAYFLCWLIPGYSMACHAIIHFCAFVGYEGDKILVEGFRVSHVFSFIEEYIQAISTHSCDLKQRSSLCRMQKSRRNLNPTYSHYLLP